MEKTKKKLLRICSDPSCRKKFNCNGECEITEKLENADYCYCPKCIKKIEVAYPDFFRDKERCKTRFGKGDK